VWRIRAQEGAIVITFVRRFGVVVPVLALLVASPAGADTETLKRSFSNLAMAPLDLILSPYTGPRSVVLNIQDIEDTTGVRAFYFLPGLFWNTGLYIGAAVLRGVAGALEFLPGLGLFFFDAELDPLFPAAENQEALVDIETPVMYIKFGTHWADQ
jgi:hypothetical protein